MNRHLGALEHAMWLIDQVVPQNFVMIARLSRASGLLTNFKDVLRQALDLLQARHPVLKSKIKEGEAPEFVSVGVPEIPLNIVKRQDDHHWIEVAEKEMQVPVPWTLGPLVRVVLLESPDKCELLVTFCHVVADALSGVVFVKNLLVIVGELLKGGAIEPESRLPQLPSSLDLLRKDIKYPPEFLDIKGRIMRAFHKPVKLSGDNEVTPEKRITRVIQRILTKTETKKLISKCREKKTSVHGALCAALMQTVVNQIRKAQNVPQSGALMIGCTSPVNIRHLFTTTIGENIGNFISDAMHFQLIDDQSSLWSAARNVKKSLQKEIKFGRDIKAIRGVGEFLKLKPTPLELVTGISQMVPPVAVSNMGMLDIPEKFGDLSLEEFHFTLSINPGVGSGFAISVTGFLGVMTINFLYSEPYLSKDRVQIMVENTLERLKDALQEKKNG